MVDLLIFLIEETGKRESTFLSVIFDGTYNIRNPLSKSMYIVSGFITTQTFYPYIKKVYTVRDPIDRSRSYRYDEVFQNFPGFMENKRKNGGNPQRERVHQVLRMVVRLHDLSSNFLHVSTCNKQANFVTDFSTFVLKREYGVSNPCFGKDLRFPLTRYIGNKTLRDPSLFSLPRAIIPSFPITYNPSSSPKMVCCTIIIRSYSLRRRVPYDFV